MKCPVCGEDDSDEFAYRVTFHYSSGTVKDKKNCLFPTTLEKILRKTITVFCANDVVEELVPKLPIKFRACINAASNVYNIQD